MDQKSIQANMPVVGSNDVQLGTVDHLDGDRAIKLSRDASGIHYYIPTSWVKSVDDKVHIDRPGKQAMAEWSERASLV